MLRFAQKSWAWRNRKQNRLEAPYCLCGVICSLLTRTFFSSIWLQARYICVLLETKLCCTSVDGLGCEGPTVLGVPWRNVVLRNVECLQCFFFPPSSFVQQKRMQVERTCCAFQWVSSQCIGKSLDSSYFLHLLDHVCLFVLQMWAATKWVRGWDEGWFIYLKKLYIDIYRYITDWYFSMFLNCNPLFRSNVFLLHPRLQAPAK